MPWREITVAAGTVLWLCFLWALAGALVGNPPGRD